MSLSVSKDCFPAASKCHNCERKFTDRVKKERKPRRGQEHIKWTDQRTERPIDVQIYDNVYDISTKSQLQETGVL